MIAAVIGGLFYLLYRASFGSGAGLREPPEPVDASGWTLVVDGSNFAHWRDDVRLEYLEDVLSSLEHYFDGARIRVFCDANLRHKFDGEEKRRFERMVGRNSSGFRETHGKSADDVLLTYASDKPRCIVVSNDWFAKGAELEMRLDVPLLRVERQPSGELFPHRYVNIFDDPDEPQARKKVPVGEFIE